MENEDISAKVMPFVKQYWLPLSLAIFGLIFFIYGLISLLGNKPQEALNFSQDVSTTPLASKSATLIIIDIEGAVVSPGVYKLPLGSIVQDALVVAKGLAEDANRSFVSKNINLAQKLTDAQKIYIPRVNEVIGVAGKGENTTPETSLSELININSASALDLDTLPGVGQVTAQKIINNRPYTKIDDLLSKKVVSAKVFTTIQNKITAD